VVKNIKKGDGTMAKYKSIFTRAVHAGERGAKPDFKPVSVPIYNSVGYLYEDLKDLDAVFGNERPGYVYARYGSPTNSALEEVLADLEEGEAALTFGSGMAAVYAALMAAGVKTGASLLSAFDVYGATYAICARLLPDWGVKTKFVEATDLRAVEEALAELKPAAIILETISNPLMKVADIPAITKLAHRAGARSFWTIRLRPRFFINLSNTGWIFASIPPQNTSGGMGMCWEGRLSARRQTGISFMKSSK
jgi:cystathionine beta-lyase/cystathionine gamma-synthase